MLTILSIKCDFCNKNFPRSLKIVNNKKKFRGDLKFCSSSCYNKYRTEKVTNHVDCANCKTSFQKKDAEIKKSKSGNHFCSRSCAGTYNAKHKKQGTRRSKLEVWLEQELQKLYPDYNILFNDKSTIKSELDIYFPDLKIAFEINGIFHYKPIYGEDKLKKIQENDKQKALLCDENNIILHSIDASKLKQFKEERGKIFLQNILECLKGVEPSCNPINLSTRS